MRRILLPEPLTKLNGGSSYCSEKKNKTSNPNQNNKTNQATNPMYHYSLLLSAIIFILLHLKCCYQHIGSFLYITLCNLSTKIHIFIYLKTNQLVRTVEHHVYALCKKNTRTVARKLPQFCPFQSHWKSCRWTSSKRHLVFDTFSNTGLTPPGRGKIPPDPVQGWFLKRLNGKMGILREKKGLLTGAGLCRPPGPCPAWGC